MIPGVLCLVASYFFMTQKDVVPVEPPGRG